MQSSALFDLRLAGSLDVVSVEVQDSPVGQTSDPVSAPCRVSLDGLDESADSFSLESIGRALWSCTLGIQGIAELWRGSLQKVDSGSVLRLRLIIDSPDLAALPWELLYDETLNSFLALDHITPIVRFVRVPITPLPLLQDLPLRLLFTGASPSNLTPLDVTGEGADIKTALMPVVAAGKLRVEVITPRATLNAILAELQRGVDLWHFAGHGNSNELIFCDAYGQALASQADKLGQLLAGEGVRLAVLNACLTGAGGGQAASVAGALVRTGLSAVVANQAEISDVAARTFSAAFYDAIANGSPVDRAVTAARKAIWVTKSNEWWKPILFMTLLKEL